MLCTLAVYSRRQIFMFTACADNTSVCCPRHCEEAATMLPPPRNDGPALPRAV
ncbi:MAG: hypothetical protein LBT00_09190 [Spirochaetaceae bacterium]|nr:hypothetical protein [Spirochaetaceae bacterium]